MGKEPDFLSILRIRSICGTITRVYGVLYFSGIPMECFVIVCDGWNFQEFSHVAWTLRNTPSTIQKFRVRSACGFTWHAGRKRKRNVRNLVEIEQFFVTLEFSQKIYKSFSKVIWNVKCYSAFSDFFLKIGYVCTIKHEIKCCTFAKLMRICSSRARDADYLSFFEHKRFESSSRACNISFVIPYSVVSRNSKVLLCVAFLSGKDSGVWVLGGSDTSPNAWKPLQRTEYTEHGKIAWRHAPIRENALLLAEVRKIVAVRSLLLQNRIEGEVNPSGICWMRWCFFIFGL